MITINIALECAGIGHYRPHTLSSAVYAAGGGGTLATEMSKLPPTEAIFWGASGHKPG